MSDSTQTATYKLRGLNPEGNYTFLPYDSKAPVEEAGYRTAKITYKTNTKTGKVAGENSCIVLPFIDNVNITSAMTELLPFVKKLLETEQDKIIKEVHLKGDSNISPTDLSLDAVIKYMTETKKSNTRVSKEVLTNWFDTELSDSLTILFAEKLGISEESSKEELEKVDRFITVYKNKYTALASNLVSYIPEEATKLLEALDKVGVDVEKDMIGAKIHNRLIAMKKATQKENLLDLI